MITRLRKPWVYDGQACEKIDYFCNCGQMFDQSSLDNF